MEENSFKSNIVFETFVCVCIELVFSGYLTTTNRSIHISVYRLGGIISKCLKLMTIH